LAIEIFVCPICRERKSKTMFHCPDHCMDMCSDHVRETKSGRYYCVECQRPVNRLVFDGENWELA
jgi:hypothetical protein